MEQILDATLARYPDCALGDWAGNIHTKSSVKIAPDLNLLRFGDADYASVMHFDMPPKPAIFDFGPYPHVFWPNATEDVQKATALTMVMVKKLIRDSHHFQRPSGRAQASEAVKW